MPVLSRTAGVELLEAMLFDDARVGTEPTGGSTAGDFGSGTAKGPVQPGPLTAGMVSGVSGTTIAGECFETAALEMLCGATGAAKVMPAAINATAGSAARILRQGTTFASTPVLFDMAVSPLSEALRRSSGQIARGL